MMNDVMPIIMNTNFEKLAVIDDYTSLIWTKRFYKSGDFELVVSADLTSTNLFRKDYYVMRFDDEDVGVIEDIQINRTSEGDDQMIITGRFLGSILARRIIPTQTIVSGSIDSCINTLINQNVISPAVDARKISNFKLGSYSISKTIEDAQYVGDNLLEVIEGLCETYGIGYKVTLDDQNQFVFTLYEGENRTYDQTKNPYVIFSDAYDNLISMQYEENYQKMVNTVFVDGEEETEDGKHHSLWVNGAKSGLGRFELYSDQSNLSAEGDEVITDAQYDAMLTEAGKALITTYTKAFSGEVNFDYDHNKEVNVGDIVVIESCRWNIRENSRIVEMIESVSESGEHKFVPTFGV